MCRRQRISGRLRRELGRIVYWSTRGCIRLYVNSLRRKFGIRILVLSDETSLRCKPSSGCLRSYIVVPSACWPFRIESSIAIPAAMVRNGKERLDKEYLANTLGPPLTGIPSRLRSLLGSTDAGERAGTCVLLRVSERSARTYRTKFRHRLFSNSPAVDPLRTVRFTQAGPARRSR